MIALIFANRIPHKGLVIDTSSPLVKCATKAALFLGGYEGAEIRFIDRYLRTDLDVIELGGSIGVVSCHICKRLHSRRRLIVVEPFVELVDITRQNLLLNGYRNATVIRSAIDYQNDSAFVSLERGETSVSGRVVEVSNSDEVASRVTLSGIIRQERIEEFTLVSDIEGAEIGFIMKPSGYLSNCRQIICELHSTEWIGNSVSVEEMASRLTQVHGFDLRHRYGNCFVFER